MLVIPPLSSIPSEGSHRAASSPGRSGASSGSTTSTVTTGTRDTTEKSLRPAVYIKLRDLVDLYQIDISTCLVKDVENRDREVRDDNSNDEAIGSRKFETPDKDDGSRQPTPPVSPTSTSNLEAVFSGGATSGNKDRKKLNPSLGGYNLCLLVGQVNIVVDKLRVDRSRVRLAEVLVGDETGTVSLRARDEQIDLLQSVSSDISSDVNNSTSCSEASASCSEGKAGAIVLRNCTLELFQNKHLRLAVTKWGKMSKYPDNIASTPAPPPRMNTEWNYSLADLSFLANQRKGRKQGEDSSHRHRPSRHSLSPQISPSKSPEMVLSEHGPLSLNNNYPPLPSMQAAEMSPLHSNQLQTTLRGQWKHQYPLLSSSTTSLEDETARMSLASVNRSSSRSLGSPRQSWQSHQHHGQQLSQPSHHQQQQKQVTQQTQIGTGIESGYTQTMRRQQSYSSATSSQHQRPPHYLQHPHHSAQTMPSYVVPQHYSPQGYNIHQRQHQHAPQYVHPHTVYSHFMHQNQPQQVHVVVHQQPSHSGSNFEKGSATSLVSGPLDDRNAAVPVMHEASTLSPPTRPHSEVHPGPMPGADRGQGQQGSTPPRQPTHAPYYNIETQTMGYAAVPSSSLPSRAAPARTMGTSLHHGAGAPSSASLESTDRKAASPNESTSKRDYQRHQQQQQQQIQSRDLVYDQWVEGTPSLSSVEVPTTLSMSSSFGAMNAQAPSFDPGAVPSVVDYAKQQAPASILHPSHQHFHHPQAPYPYYSYVHPDANMMYASQAHSTTYEQDSMYAPSQDRSVQPLGSPSGADSKPAERRSSPSKVEGGVSSDVSSTGNDRNRAKPMRGNGTPPQANSNEDDKSSRG